MAKHLSQFLKFGLYKPTSDILLAGDRCAAWDSTAEEVKIPFWCTNESTVLRYECPELLSIL